MSKTVVVVKPQGKDRYTNVKKVEEKRHTLWVQLKGRKVHYAAGDWEHWYYV